MGNSTHALLVIILLLICAAGISAQIMNEEISKLRAHLNVPESLPVTTSSAPALLTEAPIRVYLATGLDMVVHENFVRWINAWNLKNGKKYGTLEIVDDMAKAQIILARYTLKDQVTTQNSSLILPSLPIALDSSTRVVPVYAYVIKRRAEGLEILWRYADTASATDNKDSGRQIVEDFFKLIKASQKKKYSLIGSY